MCSIGLNIHSRVPSSCFPDSSDVIFWSLDSCRVYFSCTGLRTGPDLGGPGQLLICREEAICGATGWTDRHFCQGLQPVQILLDAQSWSRCKSRTHIKFPTMIEIHCTHQNPLYPL